MRERWAMIGHFVVLFWFFPFSTIYFLPDLPGKTIFELCPVWGRWWEGWGSGSSLSKWMDIQAFVRVTDSQVELN